MFAFLWNVRNIGSGLTCLDGQGVSVDRWMILKYPAGMSYAYWDPNTGSVVPQRNSLNATTDGALAFTMQQLWNTTVGYAFYNDEIPNTETYNFTVGHSKGIWMWDADEEEGVFIHHSIPKFPQGPDASPMGFAGLPSNAWDYGQHLACISMSFAELERIVVSYILVAPQIYEHRGSFKSLDALINGNYNGNPLCQHIKLISKGGTGVVGFAKNAAWNQDLYDACIAPTFMIGFYVESWLHGKVPVGPSCAPYVVADIQSVQIDFDVVYSSYSDHSKWAISMASEMSGYVCVSDINRMESQFLRNGGAFCFHDDGLWTSLTSSVRSTNFNCVTNMT